MSLETDRPAPAGRTPLRTPALLRALGRRWPTLLGALAAVALALTGIDRDGVVLGLVIAAGCYVAAAASSRPWMAWGWIPPAVALAVLAGLAGLDPVVVSAVATVALVVVGLVRGAARPHLARQTAGLVGYGALAVVAALAGPTVGLALAAVALMSHGVWDLWHLVRHRDDVSPSLAEACVALDVPLGVVVLTAAFLI